MAVDSTNNGDKGALVLLMEYNFISVIGTVE